VSNNRQIIKILKPLKLRFLGLKKSNPVKCLNLGITSPKNTIITTTKQQQKTTENNKQTTDKQKQNNKQTTDKKAKQQTNNR
jgi:hypothetical protein